MFPQPASAVIPVTEDNPLVLVPEAETSIATNATAITSAETSIAVGLDASANIANLGQKLFEWAQTTLIQSIKKALLDYLVNRVINYIKGAKDGGFIGDWQSYLSGVVATQLQIFGQRVVGVDICAPFSAQLKLAFNLPPVQEFGDKITCTFDQIGENIQDFQSDFQHGKWLAYSKSWESNNNGYGVFLTASLAQSADVIAAKETSLSEAVSGQGFLSKKVCTGKLPEPDSSKGELPGPDIDGENGPNDDPATCSIVTPGAVVSGAVTQAMGADYGYINSLTGTDIGPYIAAIANAMVGRILDEGLGLVAKAASSDPPDINSYVNVASVTRSAAQRFRNESQRMKVSVRDSIQDRLTAQAFVTSASTTWLKFTHNPDDIIQDAIDQISTARQVLTYTYNELSKVIKRSQIKTWPNGVPSLCSPVKNLASIDNTALPGIQKRIALASEALDTLAIAHDDYPELDPEFVVIATTTRFSTGNDNDAFLEQIADASVDSLGLGPADVDPSEEHNIDQLAILKEVQYELDYQLLENTTSTQARLGDLNNVLGDSAVNNARQFKNAMQKIDNDIEKVFKVATAYADRLSKCLKPRDENDLDNGVVVGWTANDPGDESIGKPARNPGFPWETDADIQNQTETIDNATSSDDYAPQ